MADPKNRQQLHQAWRDKIRASVLINHLRNHVLGRIDMKPTQIKAAEILLNRVMPTLQATEHTGEGGGPIEYTAIYYAEPTAVQLHASALPAPDPESIGQRH